ncbi:antitoxin Xre/MbcA/ParS toxin-binding domain-containing protein [Roseateles sp. GG27B]
MTTSPSKHGSLRTYAKVSGVVGASVRERDPITRLSPTELEASGPAYQRSQGVDAYLRQMHEATPMQMIEIERQGVAGSFIVDLSERMDLPPSRLFAILRVPKATAARKVAADDLVDGRAGQAAIGMIKLLGLAQAIVSDSTASEAESFDAVRWLGQWIERPQPALGGRKPSDLLDTPTGVDIVARLLGALQSGAYQ